ncbi:MAG: GDP-mannose 4,6-dehydratase [Bacteroidales bacterium]|nr:GDP-mannose 4,6-dehydratase [Bacteroidales bacterium]
MKILITGTAGFIGFHLAKKLIERGDEVIGLDNINDYYDENLKYARLNETGISRKAEKWGQPVKSSKYRNYQFIRMNLEDKEQMNELFQKENFDLVINLAAQAGVRYSIENPDSYIQSNIVGFFNILEACRHYNVKRLIFASSSSVYGMNKKVPFSEDDNVDHPISLYAATKKSNELMAYTYSHLYGIQTIGLRFFTVYGPWGRPDMAYYKFTKAILEDKPIEVYNHGKLKRDFTYIDDIIHGVVEIVKKTNLSEYEIFNIGNSKTVDLLTFIETLEKLLQKKAIKKFVGMQAGDVKETYANISKINNEFGFLPNTETILVINFGYISISFFYIPGLHTNKLFYCLLL